MFAFLLSLDAFGEKLTFKPNASIVLNTVSTLGRRAPEKLLYKDSRPTPISFDILFMLRALATSPRAIQKNSMSFSSHAASR